MNDELMPPNHFFIYYNYHVVAIEHMAAWLIRHGWLEDRLNC